MTIITPDQFFKGSDPSKATVVQKPQSITSINKPFGTPLDVLKGVGKGALDSSIGLARGLQGLGQRTIAAVDPTRNLEQVRKDTGFRSLQGPDAAQIDTQLKAKNNAQKLGKVLEFAGELLYPVGATEELGNIGGKISKKAGATFDNLGTRLSSMEDHILGDGVNVKDKLGDLIVNLDQKTKTALDRTPKEVFDKVAEQGRKALADDRVTTPLEQVGHNAIDAIDHLRNNVMPKIGEEKARFLKIPSAFEGNGIKKFREEFNSFMNSRTMIENDKPIVQNIYNQFRKLGDTPTKGQVDKFIDYAQEVLYSGEKNLVQPTSGKTTLQIRGLISKLNNNLKSQLPEKYGELNQKYSELIRLTNEINTNLGKEGRSAGAFVKRLFSPSDARTKELFSQLEKETGIDFTRDARLAKFVMEALGDTRASSLLEQIPTSAKGALDKAINYGIKKVADPIKGAARYIERTKPSSFNKGGIPSTSTKGLASVKAIAGGALGTGAFLAGTAPGKPVTYTKAPEKMPQSTVPQIVKTVKEKDGQYHVLDTGTQVREVTPNLANAIAGVKKPEGLPKGLIEAILMKESSMGKNKASYNPNIGEYAWLVGFTNVAKKELKRNGIKVNLDTPKGAIQAAADYAALSLKKHKNPVDLYNYAYSSGKLPQKALNQFGDLVKFYSQRD